MLIPALAFAAPSSEVSLARIWGLGAHRAAKFTVVASIVRPLQSSADNGADRHGQTSFLIGPRGGAEKRWIKTYRASELGCFARSRCSGCGGDDCMNVSSVSQSEVVTLGHQIEAPTFVFAVTIPSLLAV
jgi:hypothetical protein